MKKFTNYQYITNSKKNKIYALSTYAGKTIKGTATCSPGDKFNIEAGRALAAARCNKKIAKLRKNRAMRQVALANEAMERATKYYYKMREYYEDATSAYTEAMREVKEIETSLGYKS